MTARIEEVAPEKKAAPKKQARAPRLKPSTREATWGFVFISPWIFGLLVFTAIPIVVSLLLSFTNYNLLGTVPIRFVGLFNYNWALSDPATINSIFITLKFGALSLPLTVATALGIALLVNHRLLMGKRVFRTLFFLPVQIPVTASVFIWIGFVTGANRMPIAWLQSTSTSIGQVLSSLPVVGGLAAYYPTGWFTDKTWTLPWLILMSIWSVGNMTLIFLAGLQTVPTELYEAARVDGAGAWRTFRNVTLPMISPMIFYNLILSIIGIAGYFTQAYIWGQNGRPNGQNLVYDLNLYNVGWGFNAMGRACALAWILFVFVICVAVVLFATASRWVYYAGAEPGSTRRRTRPDDSETPAETPRGALDEVDAPAYVARMAVVAPAETTAAATTAAALDEATETAAADAATAPTAASRRRAARPRSKIKRFARTSTSRTAMTVFASVLCALFLLPFLLALSRAFDDPTTAAMRGAPLYPAAARTYTCTDSKLCTYQPGYVDPATGQFVAGFAPIDVSKSRNPKLLIYSVPGHGNLALLNGEDPKTGQPSIFIDPVAGRQIDLYINPAQLSEIWDAHVTLDNFATAVDWAGYITDAAPGGFARWLLNSGVIAVFSTIGATLSCVLVAYGFARFRFPGRDVLFLVLIGSVLIPYQVTLVPQFIVYRMLGWTSSFLPLIVPNFFGNALYIFLLRQYFLSLTRDLDEAAMVDGAGPLRILRSVIVPQAWPAIAAVALFQFFFSWSDFMGPLIYLSGNSQMYTLSLGVNYFMFTLPTGGTNGPGILEAGAFITLIVPVIIFFAAQRVFMRGVVISGVEK
jgi:ABC-type sugar transport system permease subunit